MRKLRLSGLSTPEIARLVGVSRSTAHRHVGDVGEDQRAAVNRERAAKPPPWLKKARKLRAEGLTRNEVAKELGVAKSSVYRMLAKFG